MDLDQVKEVNKIEDVISAEYPLRGIGRYLRAEQHDSLVVDTHSQAYFWNSAGEQGDVITWVMKRHQGGFKGAVEWLCQQGGLPAPRWGGEDSQTARERRSRSEVLTVAARHWVHMLRSDPGQVARDYCYSRGWTDETIRLAGLGFAGIVGTDYAKSTKELLGEFSMHEIKPSRPAAAAALKVGPGMLVYPHVEAGRVVYVSCRSIEGKQHYNPPADLIGERRVYCNWLYSPRAEKVVVVEGQADAITCGQWDLAAVALAGLSVNQTVLKLLARHETIYVALDQDEAGVLAARKIADALGPLTRMVAWPEEISDANEWLQAGGSAEDCRGLLAAASTWVEVLAAEVGTLPDYERPAHLDKLVRVATRLRSVERVIYRKALASAANIGVSVFDKLLGDEQKESDEKGEEVIIPFTAVGGMIDGHFLETLYVPPEDDSDSLMVLSSGKTMFAMRDPDGNIDIVPYFDHDGIRYSPISANLPILRERTVVFAPEVGELYEIGELLVEVQALIHKYIDTDKFYEVLASYYVVASWFYDVFDTLAYLRVIGDTGTGKSRFLQVVGNLCFRPINMNAGSSISSMFRLINFIRGTLILDEGDFSSSDETSDIAKLLNVGYQRRQGYIYRSGSRDKDFATELFVVFGPKVISTRKDFQDRAIRSRCLTKEMGAPTSRMDIPDNLPDSFWDEEMPQLQAKLLRLRLEQWDKEINDRPVVRDELVEPRLRQVTAALQKIIGNEPEMQAKLRQFIRQYNQEMITERGQRTEAKVLDAMYVQYELQKNVPEGEKDYSLGTLALIANDLMDYENGTAIENWSRYQSKERNRGVSSKGAGNYLKRLHLQTRRHKDRKRRYHVVWEHKRIEAAWKRYGLIDDDAKVALMETYFAIQALVEEHENQKQQQYGLPNV